MNSIEEKLWNYIDGTLPVAEQQAIALLIEQDEVYASKYNELLQLNNYFAAIELDEPGMAFTYNVMEGIRTEHALKPLKATIDKRIILGIAGFFILTMAVLLIYALSSVNWTGGSGFKMPQQLTVEATQVNSYFKGPAIKAFLFFDVVMALFFIDYYLRRKSIVKEP